MQGGDCSFSSKLGFGKIKINENNNIDKIKKENNLCYLDIKKLMESKYKDLLVGKAIEKDKPLLLEWAINNGFFFHYSHFTGRMYTDEYGYIINKNAVKCLEFLLYKDYNEYKNLKQIVSNSNSIKEERKKIYYEFYDEQYFNKLCNVCEKASYTDKNINDTKCLYIILDFWNLNFKDINNNIPLYMLISASRNGKLNNLINILKYTYNKKIIIDRKEKILIIIAACTSKNLECLNYLNSYFSDIKVKDIVKEIVDEFNDMETKKNSYASKKIKKDHPLIYSYINMINEKETRMDDPRLKNFNWSPNAVHNTINNNNKSNYSPVVKIYKTWVEEKLRNRLTDLNNFLKK
jgi:hypothetical protein